MVKNHKTFHSHFISLDPNNLISNMFLAPSSPVTNSVLQTELHPLPLTENRDWLTERERERERDLHRQNIYNNTFTYFIMYYSDLYITHKEVLQQRVKNCLHNISINKCSLQPNSCINEEEKNTFRPILYI